MLLDIIFVIIGLIGLFYGGDWLVNGSSRLASSFGIEPLIIGITIVAFGTSVPELLVNLSAAFQGSTTVAIGNVVGSNIANIGLILGVTGLIYPISVKATLVRREIPILIFITIVAVLLGLKGEFGTVDGVLLFAGFLAFNAFMYWATMRERKSGQLKKQDVQELDSADQPAAINRGFELGRIVVGIILLGIAANLLITGATSIALAIGVSELVISITLIAFGTSLPELAASVIAALKQESDIAIGNVIGSNIANILMVLGATALVKPVPVPQEVITMQFPVMIIFTLLLLPFAWDRILQRREAFLFLGGYTIFIIATVLLTNSP